MDKVWKHAFLILALINLFILVAGQPKKVDPAAKIRDAICDIYDDVRQVAIPLAIAVYMYGGAKYVYSSDDPGGRKEAKKICINALVGLIIVGAACSIVQSIAGSNPCPGITC